jgi:type VI secretion system protein ImpG
VPDDDSEHLEQPDKLLRALLPYYEEELSFLRHRGRRFAETHGELASRLGFRGDRVDDPHIERLLESFAFLAARTRKRLDDGYDGFTQSLLGSLFPAFMQPLPSLAVAQVQLDTTSSIGETQVIPPFSKLRSLHRQEGQQCEFRTCWPLELVPLQIQRSVAETVHSSPIAGWPADATLGIRIGLEWLHAADPNKLEIQRLRLFVGGDTAGRVLELLGTHAFQLGWCSPSNNQFIPLPNTVRLKLLSGPDLPPLLPQDERTSSAHQQLLEYFVLPQKHQFVELSGLTTWPIPDRTFDLCIAVSKPAPDDALRKLTRIVNAQTFRLGCVPIANLFERSSDPITIDGTRSEYPIMADRRVSARWNVPVAAQSVSGSRKLAGRAAYDSATYAPLLGPTAEPAPGRLFWSTARTEEYHGGEAIEFFQLRITDRDLQPARISHETVTVTLLCCNGDRPSSLKISSSGDLSLLEGRDFIRGIHFVAGPTPFSPLASESQRHWKLLAALKFHHRSRSNISNLRETLRLYNLGGAPVIDALTEGIRDVKESVFWLAVGPPNQRAMVRGTRVSLHINPIDYEGSGFYLFASAVADFLGGLEPANSACAVDVADANTGQLIHRFAPKTGGREVA